MKVFLVGTSFLLEYGGPAFSVSRLAVALAETGVDVALWAPDGSATRSRLLPQKQKGLTSFGGSLKDAILRFGPPDLLHDNGIWLPHNHRIARLARDQGVPRIVSPRGMLEPWATHYKRFKKRLAWQFYQERDLRAAGLHHATATSEAEHISRLGLGVPVTVIPNGVDLPNFDEREETRVNDATASNRRVALFLSRIHPKKGLPMLVKAWKRVLPPGWSLHIAGPDEGGHLLEVRKLVSTLRLDAVVKFLGPVESADRSKVYTSADLFILPSYSENFGSVIAEALAHSLPVLTTNGTPWQYLDETRSGWSVDPTEDALTLGLSKATACDIENLREMGRNGRALVSERHSWTGIAKQFVEAYQSLI